MLIKHVIVNAHKIINIFLTMNVLNNVHKICSLNMIINVLTNVVQELIIIKHALKIVHKENHISRRRNVNHFVEHHMLIHKKLIFVIRSVCIILKIPFYIV